MNITRGQAANQLDAAATRQACDECRDFARRNLVQLCAEISAWKDTGALSGEALLRTLASQVYAWASYHDALAIAEAMVTTEAIRLVARGAVVGAPASITS